MEADSCIPIPDSRFPFPSWEGLGVGSDSRFPIPVPLLGGVRGGFRFPFPSWEGLGVGSDSRFPIPVPLLGGVRGGFRFPIPDSRLIRNHLLGSCRVGSAPDR
ncbi:MULTISPECIES: hypothetical protein [unclassified Moorena]|uniref:hypothetical protein n=1 Tax=unclassified Moorena TaxID=2683338 RepID=UPI0013B89DC4|nr:MULTISPECIES: hypothetical protein [unclassified Moorena]NEP69420.1 hypothetical protein [Moorena sp. SIO3A5]NEQ09786.1 hypothetical protein [Moorena sp. SIO4E2]NEQ14822.1 hypothetical protein [Moorena sp. SIO3E2]NER86847.1 hypothetical protein [Moorena sp. SIO3A2]